MTKDCPRCEQALPLSAFNSNRSTRDGLAAYCRECYKPLAREQYRKNVERRRVQARERYANNRERFQAAAKANRPAVLSRERRYNARHPRKLRAKHAVRYAIQTGRLFKQPCEQCGRIRVEAHHDDYARPLVVRWLCRHHHAQQHLTITGD